MGWSRSGRWALRAPAPLYQAGFSAPTTHIIKAIGGWSQKEVNIEPRAASCFAKKWRVWNAHGAETCVPAERRQSTAMQTAERGGDRRAHLLRDRRRVLLLLVYFFFCVIPQNNTALKITIAETSKCNVMVRVWFYRCPSNIPTTPPRLHLALKWHFTTYHHRSSCNFYLKQSNMQIRHVHTLTHLDIFSHHPSSR